MCQFEAVCPYKDKECPKTEENEKAIGRMAKQLSDMSRILWILVGITAVQTGWVIL